MREAHLRDFVAVLEAGSVRGAARRLKLNQAAVSKNLSALERSLGVQLLVRTPHGVEPTESGRILLRRARVADSELRKAEEEIAALSGHDSAVVTVAISSTAEATLAAPAIQAFRRLQPNTLIDLRAGSVSTLTALLRDGRLDFAIGPAQPSMSPDILAERLFSSDVVVVARYGHPLVEATALSSLVGCEWIHGMSSGERDPAILSAFDRAKLPPPRFAVQRDSFSAMLFLLLQTDYLGLATAPTVQKFCDTRLLARLPLKLGSGSLTQCLLIRAGRPLTPQAQLLATEFRRAARALRR